MLGSEENRKERKKVFVQFCTENIYRNYLYIVIHYLGISQGTIKSVDRYNKTKDLPLLLRIVTTTAAPAVNQFF